MQLPEGRGWESCRAALVGFLLPSDWQGAPRLPLESAS